MTATARGAPARDLPEEHRAPAQAGARRVPVAVAVVVLLSSVTVLVVALVVAGSQPLPAPRGLPDAGVAVGWARRAARLALDAAGVLTVGAFLAATLLLPTAAPNAGAGAAAPLRTLRRRAVRAGGGLAIAWSLLAGVSLVLGAAETSGRRPADLTWGVLGRVVAQEQGRGLVLTALLAAVVGTVALRGRRSSAWLLVLATACVVPVPLSGHGGGDAGSISATSALVVHVVAATWWLGGLAALLVHAGRDAELLRVSARRFSPLALGCYLAIAGSGVLLALARLGPPSATWTSGYADVVLFKAGLLIALGAVGAAHRRWTLRRLDAGASRPFLRLAAGELVLMAAAAGAAAGLAQSSPPAQPDVRHSGSPSALPWDVDPVSAWQLLTAWRLDALVIAGVAVAWAGYAWGEATVRRSGASWPHSRGTAFRAGLLVVLVVGCSGLATYAPAMVSVQIAQLLLALVVAPFLLLRGEPALLHRRTGAQRRGRPRPDGPRRPGYGPVTGAVLVCGLLVLLYRSPVIEVVLRQPGARLVLLVAALGAGTAWLAPLRSAHGPSARSGRAERTGALLAVAACLGILAWQLAYGDHVLAGTWYLELRLGWVDPLADQRRGGALLGLAAVALAVCAAAGMRPRSAERPQS